MSFFVLPYRVLFHDTMAYGSHHFITNFRFQCLAREHLFFEHVVEASPEGRADHESILLLTHDAYMRSFAPVAVGQRVAVLMSAEERTRSSARLCFRVVRDDGVPVSCGFQTVVCVSRATGQVVDAPASIVRGDDLMRERAADTSFRERVLGGRWKPLFDDRVMAIARMVIAARDEHSGPRFLAADAAELDALPEVPSLGRGLAFVCPGQGTSVREVLAHLVREADGGAAMVATADQLARERLHASLAEWLTASDDRASDIVARAPGLPQVAVYLTAVLAARLLMSRGLQPDVVVGHSAGEVAALAIAGAWTADDGLRAIVARAAVLQSLGADRGGMVAVAVAPAKVEALLSAIDRPTLRVAVVNHDEQTVVSGAADDLSRLSTAAATLGWSCQAIPSPFPFHSPGLASAVAPFREALRDRPLGPASIPIYSPMEAAFYGGAIDLASHLVRRLDFSAAVKRLHAAGVRTFVECGPKTLAAVLRRNLATEPSVAILSPFAREGPSADAVSAALATAASRGLVAAMPVSRREGEAAPQASDQHEMAGAESIAAVRREGVPGWPGVAPVAIVSSGAVLPGSTGAGDYWQQVLEGRSGLHDAALDRPDLARHFVGPDTGSADKSYTFLGGYVPPLESPPAGARFDRAEFAGLTLAQRLLATSVAECLAALPGSPDPTRTLVVIGATADGVREYDEALLATSLTAHVASAWPADETRAAVRQIETALGARAADLARVAPRRSYETVIDRLLGPGARVVTLDAACASSLYAVVLGALALDAGEYDTVIAGGVFAPGPAGNSLFAQFRGLSARGSRPFDADADGVVFGEGAAFVLLKRLADARRAADRVRGVIGGFGLASDGRSPSVAEPRKNGQVLAMRRAYAASGIDPSSIQYVEAHATSTRVGDAVELAALHEAFAADACPSPIGLGSVKALVGHTGWAAGAASVVKMLEALDARTLPPQYQFRAPAVPIGPPFVISATATPWPEPPEGEPRRAAINSFGFGGSNGHVVLEALTEGFHRDDDEPCVCEIGRAPLAVLGAAGFFPFEQGRLRFDDSELQVPRKVRLLPDVVDTMDRGQCLALRAAAAVLDQLGDTWRSRRDRIGVILGCETKSERSIQANQRIYRDFLRARLGTPEDTTSGTADLIALLDERIEGIAPSGPYTLPGVMPNVATGRIANVFDLHGPNFVVGAGHRSLHEALTCAARILETGTCDVVLTGAIQAFAGDEADKETAFHAARGERPLGEAVLLLALGRLDDDARDGVPLPQLTIGGARPGGTEVMVGSGVAPYLWSAEGAHELFVALNEARTGRVGRTVRWSGDGEPVIGLYAPAATPRVQQGIRGPETPIQIAVPTPVAAPAIRAPLKRPGSQRLLVVADQAEWIGRPDVHERLRSRRAVVACPATRPCERAVRLDLSSEAAVAASMAQLRPEEFDAVVLVKWLDATDPIDVLADDTRDGQGVIDALFAVARRIYPRLARGEVLLGTLCLGGVVPSGLHAFTGLPSGFLKSLARELPSACVKAVATDALDLHTGLRQLDLEWSQGRDLLAVDVAYRGGERYRYQLTRQESLSTAGTPWLSGDSLVLLTGGARGVTAVLAEEILRRYGCEIVLVGRTDPSQFPEAVLSMSDEAFDAFEPTFYREERRRDGRRPMADLKRVFESYRAAREVRQTLERLAGMPGRVAYHVADVTSAGDVDRLLAACAAMGRRLDLVVHGAAQQASRALEKKSMREFHEIVAAKIQGTVNLYRSCRQHIPYDVRHHLLTSAFSFFGNDGQPDYGAANEALARLAVQMHGQGEAWTSLGWLGWAAVGMTRAREYKEVARARGLKAVTRAEGQQLFAQLIAGTPTSAAHVLVTEGEIAYYGLATDGLASPDARPRVTESASPGPRRFEHDVTLSLDTHPYLGSHLVRDRPTVPGTFEGEIAARAAKALRPDCDVVEMRDLRLSRFAQLGRQSTLHLRALAEACGEEGDDLLVRVRLLSDFVHASGRVLEENRLHFEAVARLSRSSTIAHAVPLPADENAQAFDDPYLSPHAPIRLDGVFRCLHDIRVSDTGRTARFRLADAAQLASMADFLTPAVLLDALFRFSMIHLEPPDAMPLYVPLQCGRTRLVPGINDARTREFVDALRLVAPSPRVDGDRIFSPWARVETTDGRVILAVEQMEALRMGVVPRV